MLPDTARDALRVVRREQVAVKLDILEYDAWGSKVNPFLVQTDKGLRAIVYALECAAFMPHLLTEQDCWRMPVTPRWDRTRQDWVMGGHFLVAEEYEEDWKRWLEPLGVVFPDGV